MSDQMKAYPVLQVHDHAPGLRSLYLPRVFDAYPGQFVNIWVPGVGEKPFSISDLTSDRMEISVKAVGQTTTALMACRTGEYLGVRGPFGRGFTLHGHGLIIGGGIGIAPLRFLAHRLTETGRSFSLRLGARSRSDLIFPEEMRELSADCLFFTEDGSLGTRGLVTDGLSDALAAARPSVVYATGPEAMMVAVRKILEARDIDYEFALERYMKFGIGLCGQCCLDGSGARVCVEGPVLTRADLAEVTDFGQPHRDPVGLRPSAASDSS